MTTLFELSKRAHFSAGESIISTIMAKTIADPTLISLAAGFVDYETLPVEIVRQATERIMSDPKRGQAALQYGTTIGYQPLRQAILDRMLQADQMTAETAGLSADQVILTAGSNQVLHLLGEVLLNPGDVMLCCAPSYFVYLGTISNQGARAVGIEVDADGMIPEAVERAMTELKSSGQLHRLKMLYATSYFDNPTGVTMSLERRKQLVEIVRRWSKAEGRPFYLVEDMAYREMRYHGDDVPSMRSLDPDGEHVIVTGSFSKAFSPGLRVGWGIMPPALVDPVLTQKGGIDFGSPNLNQMLMHEVMMSGDLDRHVARLRDSYRIKLDATLDAVDQFLAPLGVKTLVRPNGGLYVWLELPGNMDAGLEGPLFNRAIEQGVLYLPGQYCFPREGYRSPPNVIRLSFGIPSVESTHRGIELLGQAIQGVKSNK